MTPAPSDPIGVNGHVVHSERRIRDSGTRTYYRCQNCSEKAERPSDFHHIACGGDGE